jgi:peptide/nickel transport system substrate-binding protein
MLRRTISLIACILMLSIMLTGCAGQKEEVGTETLKEEVEQEKAEEEASQEVEQEEAVQEVIEVSQEVVVGLGRDAGTMYGYGAHPPLTRVLEPLIFRDVELSYIPGLATSWEVSDDGLIWTIYLRENVKFHDGSIFNAEAVKHNLERVSERWPDLFGFIKSIDVVDEYTIMVEHNEPFAPFIYSLAWPGAAMISPDAIDEEGKVTEPIGTGPFKRVEWVADDKLVLERNEDWWGGMPKLERITLKYIPDANTRMMALEAGEIDMIIDTGGVLPEQVAMLETRPEIEVLTIDGAVPHYMSLNTNKAPFDDVKVRKAIMYAIDPESIIQYALEGYGKLMTSITPHSEQEGLQAGNLFKFNDPEKAQELLQEAGWVDTDNDGVLDKNGQEFKITFLLATGLIGRWPYMTIAEIVQEQLREMGIIVEIKVVETGLWRESLKIGETDLSIRPWAGISPQTRLQAWLHSEGEQNLAMGIFLSNPHVDELIEQAMRTTDDSVAQELLLEVQEIAAEEVSVIPIYDEVLINAVRECIEGYELHPWFFVNWEDIYVTGVVE